MLRVRVQFGTPLRGWTYRSAPAWSASTLASTTLTAVQDREFEFLPIAVRCALLCCAVLSPQSVSLTHAIPCAPAWRQCIGECPSPPGTVQAMYAVGPLPGWLSFEPGVPVRQKAAPCTHPCIRARMHHVL
jgi:hypothetical protein